ncbi:hypothetical protein DM01DRAFT_1105712 [Hesseltinella vesiculosa]|uniref:Uncharacterized protein n=1 Tax=Hesseltinella vesiculosa TaxID=101127 RepID=A0A1X2GAT9_9FUNG|nr:hypothetical protein DM01DRAFT_1105712 [Hesseltinella vesiculosa]
MGFCQRACSASQGNHWVGKGVYTMGSNLLVRERARTFPKHSRMETRCAPHEHIKILYIRRLVHLPLLHSLSVTI